MSVPPADVPESALALQLFGPFAAHCGGHPLPKMRTRKEQWLLALLALHSGETLDRVWLATTLWPDGTEAGALGNLRRSLGILRDALGPEARRILSPTPRTLRLDLEGAACDVADFDDAVCRGAPEALATAVALYRGPLLLGCLEDWVVPEREARERAVLDALETLAGRAQERGDGATASGHWQRALELDPLRETALRGLMASLAAGGRHAAATEAFRAFRLRLRRDLNADPDPETVALNRQMQAQGRLRAGAPAKSRAPAGPAPAGQAHLPALVSSLVGREAERDAVLAQLDRSRLVTLTGAGGVGKTRLALVAARALAAEFEDGAWFVDLAPLSNPDLLVSVVASSLGVREQPGQILVRTLREWLKPRRLLLVLDNCEQVAHACAHLALDLLRDCPDLTLLATSRETLRVPGEAVYRVPGLPEDDAVRLFAERASQANPAFPLTPANAELAASICRRLDGIPLAIEMAAARTRAMSLAQITARLDDAFRLLSEPGGDLMPRHQTLRATLDWSYDLLAPAEKTLLARLSVFAGGWTLEAAEAVCADPLAPGDVLDLLAGLVDKSLVVYESTPGGTGRYRLLETVRQYGRERLRAGGAEDAIRRRHTGYFLDLAEQAEPQMAGADQAEWLDRMATEHDNLRAALARLRGADPAEHLRLAGALTQFWFVRGHLSEGRAHLGAALARDPADAAPGDRLKALRGAADLAQRQGDFAESQCLFEQAISLARASGDRAAVAALLGAVGGLLSNQGDYAGARAAFAEALALAHERGDRAGEAGCRAGLGFVAREQGAYAEARGHLEEAARISRDLGDALSLSSALGNLAWLAAHQGQHDEASQFLEQTLSICRSLGNRLGEAWVLGSLGQVRREAGDAGASRALLEQALGINRALGNRAGEAWNLSELGALLVERGDYADAEALLRQALTISREIGLGMMEAWTFYRLGRAAAGQGEPDAKALYLEALGRMWEQGIVGVSEVLIALAEQWAQDGDGVRAAALLSALEGAPPGERTPARQAARDRAVAACRAALGEAAFDGAWAEGRALGWARATEYALAEAVAA